MYGDALYGSALYGSNSDTRMVWLLSSADVNVEANPLEWQQYIDLQIASVNSQANAISLFLLWDLDKATVNGGGNDIEFDPSGSVDFSLEQATTHVQGNPLAWHVYFDLNKASVNAEANPISWHQFLDLVQAKTNVLGNDIGWTVSGTAFFDLHTGEVLVNGNSIEFAYRPVSEIPDLIAKRSTNFTSAVIDVRNPIPSYYLNIIRTNEHIGGFEEIDSVPVSSLPYTNSSLNVNGNYRYVGTYSLPGNIGGVPVLETGEESTPRITIGKNRSL